MEVSDAKRLRALEEENNKLKRLLADALLDNAALKDVVSRKGKPTSAAGGSCGSEDRTTFSERRACGLVNISTSVLRYSAALTIGD